MSIIMALMFAWSTHVIDTQSPLKPMGLGYYDECLEVVHSDAEITTDLLDACDFIVNEYEE
jgi:hypothetical protein